jgi:hypothetical protein
MASVARTSTKPARIAPGTLMRAVVAPSMIGPYMSGQRTVITGYVHRAKDVQLRSPADACQSLDLVHDGSSFSPDMVELYFLQWQARDIDIYVLIEIGGQRAGDHGSFTEYYLEPTLIPFETKLCRLTDSGEESVARYDGLAWRLPREG